MTVGVRRETVGGSSRGGGEVGRWGEIGRTMNWIGKSAESRGLKGIFCDFSRS